MASYTLKRRDNGEWFAQIRVCLGRDPVTDKQIFRSMMWKASATTSEKVAIRELAKAAGQFEAECKSGQFISKKERKEQAWREYEEAERKPTFAKYVERFMQRKAAEGAAPTTIETYEKAIARPLEAFGAVKMEDITPAMLSAFLTDLQANGTNKQRGTRLTHRTIVFHYETLHTIFQDAVQDEIIPTNPLDRVKRPKARKDEIEKEAVYYDEAQIAYILECIEKEPLFWRAMLSVMAYTGCRRGEAAGLKWEDVHFQGGEAEIVIRHNVQYTRDNGVYDGTPKSGKSRTVYITSPKAIATLKEWKEQQTLNCLALGIRTNGYCFTQADGTNINPQQITHYCTKFGKRYNLPGFHAHALRHTFASIAARNNIDPVTVSKMLGHSTPGFTLKVYAHAFEQGQKEASNTVTNAMESKMKQA